MIIFAIVVTIIVIGVFAIVHFVLYNLSLTTTTFHSCTTGGSVDSKRGGGGDSHGGGDDGVGIMKQLKASNRV